MTQMDPEPPLGKIHARIVVVDDHPLMRSAIRHMLGKQADLEVVGEAADGQRAVELCRTCVPIWS
jgi:DNA-binding NarL/FixJ family response regulator